MKKILLIEDNPDVRQNTAEILQLASFQVVQAENGKVGVELAKENQPDLIICDIMMPELDGYGVLYMLGKNSKTASIPFIFLTAKTEKQDVRKGMVMGADDYLTKPFDEMELLDTIESRLKRADQFKTKFSSNSDDIVKFLDEAKGLNALDELSENRKSRVFPKKTMIFFEGDYPNSLYFLKSGKIKTYKMNDDGKEFITGLFKPGEFIGYTAILENDNYPDSAMVMEDAEILSIPRTDFLALLNKNRDVANRFIKMLSAEIVEKENQLLDLAYNTVRKRVAQALVKLNSRYAETQETNDFSMAVSRDDLASMVGTTTESVIRTLSDFKEEGLIEIQGRNITLKDVEGLDHLKF